MGGFNYGLDYDALPVGATIESPIDLETASNGKYLLLDGRDMVRGKYPELDKLFTVGTFTATNRTLNAVPVAVGAAEDSTNFLLVGAAGTSPLQASPDGITWSTSATWGTSTSPASIIVAGSRFIMAGSVVGDLTAPYVSTTNQTAANQVAKTNWTATTGGFTTTRVGGLAYSPTLGLTVGIPDAAGTSIYTLADGATAWTTRTATSRTKYGVVWSGKQFIVTTTDNYSIIQKSTDGTTWTEQVIPFATPGLSGVPVSCVSDGAGTVVITCYSGMLHYFIVSKDGGDTWRRILVQASAVFYQSGIASAFDPSLSYANGKFCGQYQSGQMPVFSTDGITWQEEPISYLRGGFSTTANRLLYKNGIYLAFGSGTGAITLTEDAGKYRLPSMAAQGNDANVNVAHRPYSDFIKARSK